MYPASNDLYGRGVIIPRSIYPVMNDFSPAGKHHIKRDDTAVPSLFYYNLTFPAGETGENDRVYTQGHFKLRRE